MIERLQTTDLKLQRLNMSAQKPKNTTGTSRGNKKAQNANKASTSHKKTAFSYSVIHRKSAHVWFSRLFLHQSQFFMEMCQPLQFVATTETLKLPTKGIKVTRNKLEMKQETPKTWPHSKSNSLRNKETATWFKDTATKTQK